MSLWAPLEPHKLVVVLDSATSRWEYTMGAIVLYLMAFALVLVLAAMLVMAVIVSRSVAASTDTRYHCLLACA